MSRWSTQEKTWTPIATADAATTLASASYHALQGGTALQRINIYEVYMGGQAGASSPSIMVVARNSTVGVTLSVGTNAALDPATAAFTNPAVGYNTATTPPQRSTTLYLLNLSYNAFGGIVRWVASPGSELGMLGAAASFGDTSLSAFTGGTPGLTGSHMLFEIL